jgi:ssRNA-specific RNase YbeY (16S rRNA maturation enzyme)
VHGLLHLLDYDHAEDVDAETMQRRERELLARHHRAGAQEAGGAS